MHSSFAQTKSAETVSDNRSVSNVECEKVESEKAEKAEEQLPQDDEVSNGGELHAYLCGYCT